MSHVRRHNPDVEAGSKSITITKSLKPFTMYDWPGQLGSLYEYRDVSYVNIARDGRVRCLLCETGWMYSSQRFAHFHGSRHVNRYRHLKKKMIYIWQGQLGGLHQFREVPYVDHSEDGSVRCSLCGTGWMYNFQRIQHFHGSRHAKRYRYLKNIEMEQKAQLEQEHRERLETRIKALGLRSWRDAVTAGIQRNEIKNAEASLEKFEKMERLSLLELAVVKAKAVDGVIFRNTTEIFEQQAVDPEFDASVYLNIQRVVSGCEVIVPAVTRFL
jgi:hypothetical protein